jgi:excisionase family DNA binding protein
MTRKPVSEAALYVRLPSAAVGKLDRAAERLGVHKKDLVAGLVDKYVDPDSRRGLDELGQLPRPRRVVELAGGRFTVGSYSFQPYEPPEVLTLAQASELLQLPAATVEELAHQGRLPGRQLGQEWRFSRAALLEWLATPPSKPPARRR